jgi:sigma-E factor negative regulatory protein RseC
MGDFQEIDHAGVVKSVKDGIATVEILQKTSCASCELTGVCSSSESSIKEVEVPIKQLNYQQGDHVNIVFTRSEGFTALFIGYVLPFIVMVTTMSVAKVIGYDDLVAGLASLLILIPYYGSLFFLKNKIRALFEFRLDGDK